MNKASYIKKGAKPSQKQEEDILFNNAFEIELDETFEDFHRGREIEKACQAAKEERLRNKQKKLFKRSRTLMMKTLKESFYQRLQQSLNNANDNDDQSKRNTKSVQVMATADQISHYYPSYRELKKSHRSVQESLAAQNKAALKPHSMSTREKSLGQKIEENKTEETRMDVKTPKTQDNARSSNVRPQDSSLEDDDIGIVFQRETANQNQQTRITPLEDMNIREVHTDEKREPVKTSNLEKEHGPLKDRLDEGSELS